MNTKFPSVLYWSKVAISGVILGFSLLGAQAWVPAPGSPPMSDVRGPITTGSDAQVKNGPLGISGLLKAYSGIDANGKSIANVAAPVGANDAATKAYVDAAGGEGGAGASCGGGVTGGYVLSDLGRGTSCSTWGKGARSVGGGFGAGTSCQAESGYSCGGVGSFPNTNGGTTYYICVKN